MKKKEYTKQPVCGIAIKTSKGYCVISCQVTHSDTSYKWNPCNIWSTVEKYYNSFDRAIKIVAAGDAIYEKGQFIPTGTAPKVYNAQEDFHDAFDYTYIYMPIYINGDKVVYDWVVYYYDENKKKVKKMATTSMPVLKAVCGETSTIGGETSGPKPFETEYFDTTDPAIKVVVDMFEQATFSTET